MMNPDTLPKYRSRHTVRAVKIRYIEPDTDPPGGACLIPEDIDIGAIWVDADWIRRQAPMGSGYYVLHDETGYRSWTAIEAFERNYGRVDQC